MALLAQTEVQQMIDQSAGWCVSLFMPVERGGRETRQNPIRLKNLLQTAEEQLNERGADERTIAALLAPIHELHDDAGFWRTRNDGLAVFRSADWFQYYWLPYAPEELVVSAPQFHVKPLLPLITAGERFYVLALSQQQVRLLHATRYSVNEIDLADIDMPHNIDELLQYDDPERQLQWHTGTGARSSPQTAGGQRGAMFHGQGLTSGEYDKVNLLRYFQQIDNGLHEILRNEDAPLVLAGVDYLLPLYHEANHYQHLVEQGITGNPDTLRNEELHEQALPIIDPIFAGERQAGAERYAELANTDQASADLRAVVPAAAIGRVDRLFVAAGQHVWGRYDPSTNAMKELPENAPESVDLLDLAALYTWLNSGTVFLVPPEEMPAKGATAAAVFRY